MRHLLGAEGGAGVGPSAALVCPGPCVWLSATNLRTVAASSSDTSFRFVRTCARNPTGISTAVQT